jgi:hypothetical protein
VGCLDKIDLLEADRGDRLVVVVGDGLWLEERLLVAHVEWGRREVEAKALSAPTQRRHAFATQGALTAIRPDRKSGQ